MTSQERITLDAVETVAKLVGPARALRLLTDALNPEPAMSEFLATTTAIIQAEEKRRDGMFYLETVVTAKKVRPERTDL